VDPVPDPILLRKSGIEPGPLDHRGGPIVKALTLISKPNILWTIDVGFVRDTIGPG
jgi:hypothetical protein